LLIFWAGKKIINASGGADARRLWVVQFITTPLSADSSLMNCFAEFGGKKIQSRAAVHISLHTHEASLELSYLGDFSLEGGTNDVSYIWTVSRAVTIAP